MVVIVAPACGTYCVPPAMEAGSSVNAGHARKPKSTVCSVFVVPPVPGSAPAVSVMTGLTAWLPLPPDCTPLLSSSTALSRPTAVVASG